eukprot:scaffold88118_cov48-Phaeocystis_antarctica.AAC.1
MDYLDVLTRKPSGEIDAEVRVVVVVVVRVLLLSYEEARGETRKDEKRGCYVLTTYYSSTSHHTHTDADTILRPS